MGRNPQFRLWMRVKTPADAAVLPFPTRSTLRVHRPPRFPRNAQASSAIVPIEALYRSLIERVPGIVYISQFGSEAKWHYVSLKSRSISATQPKSGSRIPRSGCNHVHPEDRELVLAGRTTPAQNRHRVFCGIPDGVERRARHLVPR